MNPFVSMTTAGVMAIGATAAFLIPSKTTLQPAGKAQLGRFNIPRLGRTMTPPNPLAPFTKVELAVDASGDGEAADAGDIRNETAGTNDRNVRRMIAGQWQSFDSMHEHYTRSFVESEGNGISRVMTFNAPYQRRLLVNGIPHQVTGLNLIGLMKDRVVYKAPWVNVLRNRLTSYETRQLSDIENKAVQYLVGGESYVWQPSKHADGKDMTADAVAASQKQPEPGTLIAGLRATSTCIGCHDVKQNELLGAFIYKLQPEQQSVHRGLALTMQDPVDDSLIGDAK